MPTKRRIDQKTKGSEIREQGPGKDRRKANRQGRKEVLAGRGRRVMLSNRQRKIAVDGTRLREVADLVLASLGFEDAELSVVLVSDRRIRQLNRQYLGRDRPTDVLAFSQWEGGGDRLHPACLGDVVISAETASEQAADTGVPLEEELDLLLAHGVLHLVGYEHTKTPEEALAMERKQRQLLRRIRRRFPSVDENGARNREPS